MKPLAPFLALLLIVVLSSAGRAETKTKALGPVAIVKDLYRVQQADNGPFFQTKNRAIVDQYFMKDLADRIWKDALSAKGDIGALDFDPLFGSQDPQITEFKMIETGRAADAKFRPEDKAIVQVTFKDSGKKRTVSFAFDQDKSGAWKIFDISYPDNISLRETLGAK